MSCRDRPWYGSRLLETILQGAIVKRSGPGLLSLLLAITACGGSSDAANDTGGLPAASRLYEDFSTSAIGGARWNQGEYRAELTGGMAALSHAVAGARPSVTYNTNLVVRPPSSGDVTTFQSELVVDSALATGTAFSRGNIDLLYQPLANRLQGPSNTDNLIVARVTLQQSVANAGLKARYLLFECTAGVSDCTQSTAIGMKSGTWPDPVAVTTGTPYTVSITVDRTAKTFTFAISGGTLGSLSETVDVSAVTTPWAPDLSASNFYQARLRTQVGGGSTGGDGAIAARFDDVRVGVDGGSASLFDDFTAGTTFDSSKWAIGGENVQLASGAVQMSLEQSDRPTSLPLNLADTSASALRGRRDRPPAQRHGSGARRRPAPQVAVQRRLERLGERPRHERRQQHGG